MHSIRIWLWAVAAVASVYAGSAAAQVTHSALLDLDSNVATGCTVTTAAGNVTGIEARITATVSGQPPVVTSVTHEQCTGAGFGAPTAQPAGYPVGVNLGTGGADVVEFATSLTGLGQGGPAIITFVSQTALGADLVVVPGVILPGQVAAPTQPAIIPATGLLTLVLLALLVLWLVRKHPGIGSTMALLFLFGAGVVWAANFVTDGAIGDWTGHPPRATDANNDATSSEMTIEIVAVFAETEGGNLNLRVDVRDAQNQPPVANAPAATVLNEDGSATITLTGSDPEGAPLTFAIATAPTRGTLGAITPINATSASVLYTATANQNGADNFTFTVNDGSSTSAAATASLTITPVNDAPVVNPQTFTSPENVANGTVVGTVAAADPDIGQTLTWSITAGNTGGAFAINPATGQITVADTTDIIPANSPFALTVQATDNGAPPLNGSNTITVNVTSVNDEPSFVAGPNQNATEDDPAVTVNTWATAISAGPPDEAGQTLAFTVSNNANALFAVQPAIAANGTLTYTPAPNANGVANVSVFLQDNGGTAAGGDDTSPTVNFTITIAAVNDTPSFMLPAAPNQNVLQNSGPATVASFASTLSAGPADESAQTLSFNVSNDNNALFSAQPAIAPNGTLTFTPANGQIGSANVSVTISDSAGATSAAQTFSITLEDVNEAPVPTTVPPSPLTIAENTAASTTVSDIAPNDPDVGQTHAYAFVSGNTGGAFAVDANGVITVAGPLDFEGSNDPYTLVVSVTDNGTPVLSANISITINLSDVNEAPTFTSPATFTVAEDSGGVGGVVANDPDGDSVSYAITGGADAADFLINPSLGILVFQAPPDFEAPVDADTNNVYELVVTVSDGTNSAMQSITVTVTNVNEPPSFTSSATVSTPENQLVAYTAIATDGDGDAITYSLTGGADQALFSMHPTSGVVSFLSAPDLEAPADAGGNNVYDIVVSASDGTAASPFPVAITVTNVNESPAFTSSPTFTVAEDSGGVGGVIAVDPEGDSVSYAITGGADAADFLINPSFGILVFQAPPDFEAPVDADANNDYELVITASDGTVSAMQSITVTVTNVNETPFFTSSSVPSSPENQVVAYTAVATDGDSDPVTYSITGGADQMLLSIHPTTGVVSFLAPPNFEAPSDAGANNVYDVVISASDGSATVPFAVAITVTNVNEAPSITSPAVFSIAENVSPVGTITASDPEGAALTFSITGGADAADLAIHPSSGALSFVTAPNFEAPADADVDNSYVVQVTASDGTTPTNQTVTVTVTNLNEGPAFTSAATANVPENTAVTAFTVTAVDDEGDAITFAITGGADAADLTINPGSGAISFNVTPNFEGPTDADANNTYVVTLSATATDGTANQTLTLTVTNVNEAPTITSAAPGTVPENTAGTFHTVTATDPDLTTPTFALVPGADAADFTINPASGVLSFTPAPNFEAPADVDTNNVYVLTVRATDGTLFDDETYNVSVTDVNEAPTAVANAYDYTANTEVRVAGHAGIAAALTATTQAINPLANDTDPDTNPAFNTLTAVAVANGVSTNNGSFTIATDGTLRYTPPAGFTGSDTLTYQLTDGTNSVNGTITFNRIGTDVVWYVSNSDPTSDGTATRDGTSSFPFNTLAAAQTASAANHIVYVDNGDGLTTGQNAGFVLKNGQRLIGNAVALSANGGATTIAAGTRPLIGNPGGIGVSAPNLSGAVVVRGLDIAGSTDAVLATYTGATAGTLEVGDNVVRAAGNQAIDVEMGSTGAVSLAVHDNLVTSTQTAIELTETAGTLTITAFDDNTVSAASAGAGIQVTGATFDATPGAPFNTVAAGTSPVGVLGDGVGGSGLTLTNVTGDLAYSVLTVFADGGSGLTISGVGTFNSATGTGFRIVSASALEQFTAVGGPAINISNATINLTPVLVSSSGFTTFGVNLDTVAGTFTASAPSSTITASASAASTAFRINGSSVNATWNGSIAVTQGTGVSLTANSGTMTFAGPLTLSTGPSPAFLATGGGTVTASDATNTLVTTTATALNVANTTIGIANLRFRSISVNGSGAAPAIGVVISNTGAVGSLEVLGNGGACTSVATCTGGAIQNIGSHGVSLVNTLNPRFTRVAIRNTADNGIDGTGVQGFSLQESFIDASGTGGGTDGSNMEFDLGIAATESNLSGLVTITNNILTNARWHGIRVLNYSGTISNAIISGNTITSSTAAASSLGSGIQLQPLGSATTSSTLTRASIANNIIANFPSGTGIMVHGGNSNGAGPGGFVGTPGDATNVVSITGNRVAGASAAVRLGVSAILATVSGGNSSSRSQGNFIISNNGTLANPLANSTGVTLGVAVNGSATGTFVTSGNVIVANNTVASGGISGGAGIVASSTETPDMTWTIENNTISQTDGNGILAVARGQTGLLKAAIRSNTVAAPLSGFRSGIRVDAGNASSVDDAVCLDITGNTSGGSGGSPGIGVRKQGTTAAVNDFGIEGLAPSPATYNQAEDHVATLNPGSVLGLAADGGSKRALAISGSNFVSCVSAP